MTDDQACAPAPSGAAVSASPPSQGKAIFSWALYDWGNSAFATTVMAGFFPLFFKQYWCAGVDAATSTLRLGVTNSVASLAVAVLAPFLGAMADAGRNRKRWLAACTAIGALSTAGFTLAGPGEWTLAAPLFVAGSFGFMAGVVFYDSLLVFVAPPDKRERASALGYSLGYLGGGLLFAVNAYMATSPETFGLESKSDAVLVSFLTVAAWWGLWSIPLFVVVKEPEPAGAATPAAGKLLLGSIREVASTFRKVRGHKNLFTFLLAYWLYIDGVDTVIRMAVDYGLSIGLGSADLIQALLVTQFVGFPAAIVFGRVGEKLGPKRGILLGIAIYFGVTTYAAFLKDAAGFYTLAVVIGLVQGGVQALSRSLYASLVPPEHASEFFGFYNMLGKFAAILGPLLIGLSNAVTNQPRWSILTLLPLFAAGGYLLTRVSHERPSAA